MDLTTYYRSDLAFIHDDGFSHLATAAARRLIDGLRRTPLSKGTVVDLGCGSGVTARLLCNAGYNVFGLDLSEAFIETARQRVPEATFRVDSFVGAELPPCVAVTAIGEVLNYAFDDQNGKTARVALFADVFAALAPGGLFLLDVAGPDRAPPQPARTFAEHPDWAILMEASGNDGILTRRITTFRRSGDVYRRDAEVHRLDLIEPDEIETELCASGFHVRRSRDYGDTPLPPGLHGFVAQKPHSGGSFAAGEVMDGSGCITST